MEVWHSLYVIIYMCFTYFEFLYGRETLVELVMCLKRLMTIAFESSEPFHLENGHICVGAIPT